MTYAIAICSHGKRVAACPMIRAVKSLVFADPAWPIQARRFAQLKTMESKNVLVEYCPDCVGDRETVVR